MLQEIPKQKVKDKDWLQLSVQLFQLFDCSHVQLKGLGVVGPDTLQYFLLSLLFKETQHRQPAELSEIVARQTKTLMEHFGSPLVNQRIFRDYLLKQGLASSQHLKELLQNAQSVILLAHKVSAKKTSKGIVSFNTVFPQAFIESLFATLETRAQ